MCKHSKQSGCVEIREICLGSNRRSALRYNKVLSAGNLISSDVANALCQKRLRLMLALPRFREKKKRKVGQTELNAAKLATSARRLRLHRSLAVGRQ